MISIFLPIPFAILGHIRGQWNEKLPLFHPRFWCVPFVAAMAWLVLPGIVWYRMPWPGYVFPWSWAVYFAACWLVFHWPAWGRWYDMGHWDSDVRKPPSIFEKTIERVPGGDFTHFLIRNIVCILPAVVIRWELALLAPIITILYWLGWKIKPDQGNWPAEWMAGAAWGLSLVYLEAVL